jgi:hypothetical protein
MTRYAYMSPVKFFEWINFSNAEWIVGIVVKKRLFNILNDNYNIQTTNTNKDNNITVCSLCSSSLFGLKIRSLSEIKK